MKMKVLFHDSCFDGAASAAVFSRFYRERVNPGAGAWKQWWRRSPGTWRG
jgi:hypothetical protein